MNWFYTPDITADAKEFALSEEESKHACRVLRLKIGDKVSLLDGNGRTFLAEILLDNPKKCLLKVLEIDFEPKETYSIHIAIAPTKNNDRLEWFLEKATELGVTDITLILTKNTERKVVKEDRLLKILVAAMKQSKRTYLPTLHETSSLKDFNKNHPQGAVAHCEETEKNKLTSLLKPENFPILIGPEGDFTSEEIKMVLESGYKPITLGKNRLRTETAGLYACMLAKSFFE